MRWVWKKVTKKRRHYFYERCCCWRNADTFLLLSYTFKPSRTLFSTNKALTAWEASKKSRLACSTLPVSQSASQPTLPKNLTRLVNDFSATPKLAKKVGISFHQRNKVRAIQKPSGSIFLLSEHWNYGNEKKKCLIPNKRQFFNWKIGFGSRDLTSVKPSVCWERKGEARRWWNRAKRAFKIIIDKICRRLRPPPPPFCLLHQEVEVVVASQLAAYVRPSEGRRQQQRQTIDLSLL